MHPLVLSALYYSYIFAICELGRQLTKRRFTPEHLEVKALLFEFFGTLQACTMLYENSFIYQNYGENAYCLALFGLVLLHCNTLQTVAKCNS